ncbi:MAG TPA: hypothetical protein VGI88_06110, partial [Verrucomicrobiae bacterium]
MKMQYHGFRFLAAICLMSLAFSQTALAVTDEEFNALKDLVIKQGQRIDQLEKTHEQDAKTHDADRQQIQQLKEQLQETQVVATNAAQRAEAAAQIQVQPVSTPPIAPAATHNFMMVGDAEVQFGKTDGSHGAFQLADFAPIFLYRKGDNVLFETG